MKVIIEADSFAQQKMSGIGHAALAITRQLDELSPSLGFDLIVVVPFKSRNFVKSLGLKHTAIRCLPPPQKIVNYLLARTAIPLPMDIFYGRGVYIFPNYKNWCVPFSKSLTIVPDVAFRIHPDTVNAKNLAYLSNNIDRWLNRTDKAITITNASADELRKYYPQYKEKLSTVYLAVDSKTYCPQTKTKIDSILKKYDLPKSYLLFVGNIEPRKNVLKLLEAYETYAKKEKDPLGLVLVGGDGWNNASILEKIEELQSRGLKVFRPRQYVSDEDMPAIYSGARALVHIAIHEGFGLPPIEALNCGTPVIASNIPSLKEILPTTAVKFVNPNDLNGIVKAMQQPPAKRATKLDFSWSKTANSILKLAEQLNRKKARS